MRERSVARVNDRGQVTLPAEVRKQLGIRTGDVLTFSSTAEGVLMTSQQAIAGRALDRIGDALREQGLTLDALIESGREVRGALLLEHYGIPTVEPAR